MGLLADFFVASSEDAFRYMQRDSEGRQLSRSEFECVAYNSFTPVSLQLLWDVLDADGADSKAHHLAEAAIAEDGESWLFQFPDAFIGRLLQLEEASLTEVAAKWGSVEVPGTAEQLTELLSSLKRLAIDARETGRSLFYLGSL